MKRRDFCFGMVPFFMSSCRYQFRKIVKGWISQNDYDDALSSLSLHGKFLTEAAPAWYALGPDGRIKTKEGAKAGDQTLVESAVSKHVRVLPLVNNVTDRGSDPDRVRLIFRDSNLRSEHAGQIEQLVLSEDYGGVDIDYEGLRASEMDYLADLIEELAPIIHSHGKVLSVSLETQSNDNALSGWKRIGDAADEVSIMTYGLKVDEPGPLVPIDWMKARLEKIINVIPKEKLAHGLPLYGLKWGISGVKSGTWVNLMKPALDSGIEIKRDEATGTPWYSISGVSVWCEDAESLKEKMEISWDMGIRRFAFWRLGGEDPAIWPMIRSFIRENGCSFLSR